MKLYLLTNDNDTEVWTNDPDVVRLRVALAKLQAPVRGLQITPKAANQILGRMADGLLQERGERVPGGG